MSGREALGETWYSGSQPRAKTDLNDKNPQNSKEHQRSLTGEATTASLVSRKHSAEEHVAKRFRNSISMNGQHIAPCTLKVLFNLYLTIKSCNSLERILGDSLPASMPPRTPLPKKGPRDICRFFCARRIPCLNHGGWVGKEIISGALFLILNGGMREK